MPRKKKGKSIVKCPFCGKELDLKPKPGNPPRLVARCNCKGLPRAVYETNAPEMELPAESTGSKFTILESEESLKENQ